MVILVLGLPGSGKTFFAKALSESINAPHVSTDLVRNELNKRGQYSDRSKEEVYSVLLKCVEDIIDNGQTAIVDGTFSKKSNRRLFENLAKKFNLRIAYIEIVATESCIKERIKKPRIDSEADFRIYKKIKAEFEPIDHDRLVLHSDKMSIEEMKNQAKDYLQLMSGDEC